MIPTADRQRRRTKRSRTGCRTCRARHVKCDETPVACKNCTFTGRSCEGYDVQRLPLPTRNGGRRVQKYSDPGNLFIMEPSNGIPWTMTSDEQRCFSHFQYKMLPALGGWFDSTLWDKLVLQLGVMERAVCHAVVALSAIDQGIGDCGTVLPGQELDNAWHFFAMDQAGRALSILNSRSSSQDPLRLEGILLCCLLFVLFELIRGRYDGAFQHLQGGLRILDGLKAQRQLVASPPHETPVNESLVAAFAQLDIQSAYYGVGAPVLHIEREVESPSGTTSSPFHTVSFLQPIRPGHFLPTFVSFHEARRAIEPLASRTFHFTSSAMSLSERDIAFNYGSLQQKQQNLLSEIARFAGRFTPLRDQLYTCTGPRDQKAADIIELLWHTMSVSIKTCLVRDPTVLDQFVPTYRVIVLLAEKVLAKYPERPTFTLDMGILPPLFKIAYSCSDYSLRWRALELIKSWPHREGLYDSRWATFVVEDRMRYELAIHGIGRDKIPSQHCAEDVKVQIAKKLDEARHESMGYQGWSVEKAMERTTCLRYWPCTQHMQALRSNCTL